MNVLFLAAHEKHYNNQSDNGRNIWQMTQFDPSFRACLYSAHIGHIGQNQIHDIGH